MPGPWRAAVLPAGKGWAHPGGSQTVEPLRFPLWMVATSKSNQRVVLYQSEEGAGFFQSMNDDAFPLRIGNLHVLFAQLAGLESVGFNAIEVINGDQCATMTCQEIRNMMTLPGNS